MPEYDVDLKTLEDMCSELSEACFLVNKNFKVTWHNESYNDFSNDPKNVLSEIFIDNSALSQVFLTGRIMRISLKNGLKITCIPVRYEDKVVSVLCILDTTPHSPIIHHFLESIEQSAILFDKDMNYIGHNSFLDKEFIDAPAVLEVALERLKSNSNNSTEDKINIEKKKNDKIRILKSLIGISHDIKLKPLLSGKHISGYVLFIMRNIKTSHKHIHKHIHKNISHKRNRKEVRH